MESSMVTYTNTYKIDHQWELAAWLRKAGLCDNLDGVGGVREFPEGGDICISMAYSLCYMAEINTIL